MPLLKRKPFKLLEPPQDLDPNEPVFQVRFTREIFRDYQEYLKRINLYRTRVWTCKVTGKTNFTYEEALVSEQHASEKVQQFPEDLIEVVLRVVQYSMLPLSDLVHTIRANLQDQLVAGLELYGKKDGYAHPCRILKVLEEETEKPQYEVAWLDKDDQVTGNSVVSEGDLIRKKLPFTREELKSFIRESTYRSLPWVVHNNLAAKFGIPVDPPEELKEKLVFENGHVVSNKKRKKNEHEEKDGKDKRNKLCNGDAHDEKKTIQYPIDDLLVQPSADDPPLTDRPLPSRDFDVPMDCVGDLLMVWDFCSSFGRLLHLSPFSLEDFGKALCHKSSNVSVIVEAHSALLSLLIKDGGEYCKAIQNRKRKPKIMPISWAEYLCDFLEMISIPELSTHLSTIRRGHYGLLEVPVKLSILRELLNQALESDLVRKKLDDVLEERQALAASKRGEAIEEGKKKREAKERLKGEAESNGMLPEHNTAPVENGSRIASSKGQNLQNGNIAENNHSLENGESEHPGSASRKKTKKLLEELEKSKEERKEFLAREMEKRCIRTNSLGKDRDHSRYWFFRRDGRVFIESSDSKQWGYYSSVEELDSLMDSLNTKGERESALKKQLEKYYPRIRAEMQKRSKDIAQRIAVEEGGVRRSTRARAPPRDNPAKAFLKYCNKWKEP